MAYTPIIRFRGFTDNWEQRKFEEIFKLYQGLQIPLSERFTEPGINRYFYITNEFLKDTCEEAYYIESPSENVVCNEEDILMTRTGNTGIVVTDVKGCFHNNFFKIKYDKDTFSKKYICYLLSTSYMQKVIMNSAGSSTIPDLSHKAFYKIVGCFPTSKEEQDKIGDNLANLDNLIILYQRKCDETKELKKYMLQKMFPKSGELIPEIRFAGFADDWERRKFGEVFEEYSEKNHQELPPLTIIQGGGTILREESDRNLQYDKSSLPGYKMVRKDDFIVHLRSFEGGLEKANSDGVISPAYHTFHGVDMDSRFYYPFFRSRYFIDVLLKPHVYGIRDGKSIDIDGMKTIMIPVPSYEEQKKIGEFIENLDHFITLHQHKCDELKEVKRFMLQNMFPQKG